MRAMRAKTPTPAPEFQSVQQAARCYIHLRDRTDSAPSIDGTRLVSTAILNGSGDVVQWVNVPATRTDGGNGSARDDRLALLADLEACLPASQRMRAVLLLRAALTQARTLAVLREITGEPWYYERLERVYGQAARQFAANLRGKGMLPADEKADQMCSAAR